MNKIFHLICFTSLNLFNINVQSMGREIESRVILSSDNKLMLSCQYGSKGGEISFYNAKSKKKLGCFKSILTLTPIISLDSSYVVIPSQVNMLTVVNRNSKVFRLTLPDESNIISLNINNKVNIISIGYELNGKKYISYWNNKGDCLNCSEGQGVISSDGHTAAIYNNNIISLFSIDKYKNNKKIFRLIKYINVEVDITSLTISKNSDFITVKSQVDGIEQESVCDVTYSKLIS